jgi:hypothetical protein
MPALQPKWNKRTDEKKVRRLVLAARMISKIGSMQKNEMLPALCAVGQQVDSALAAFDGEFEEE